MKPAAAGQICDDLRGKWTGEKNGIKADLTSQANQLLQKELDQLKGVWVCLGYEKDGEEHIGAQAKEALWNETLWFQLNTPTGNWVNINWERTKPGRQTAAAAVFRLRPMLTPKGIDLTWKSVPARDYIPQGIDLAWERATWNVTKLDRIQPGIYSVDADTLRLCWGELGKDRPKSLTTKRGDKRTIHLYERRRDRDPG